MTLKQQEKVEAAEINRAEMSDEIKGLERIKLLLLVCAH